MFCQYIHQFSRFSIIRIRSLSNTTGSQITVASTNSNQQSAIELCQEYRRRMKTRLVQAENE